jgi:hypothetical protein
MMDDVYDGDDLETGTILLVEAVGYLLQDYEGIIIHHEGEGYCLWKNPADSRIEVIRDAEFLDFDSGCKTWMHEEGSTAPMPGSEDNVIGDVPRVDPKKLN